MNSKTNTTKQQIDEYDRNQLLDWIPSLLNEKLHTLTLEQLCILHYILGYNCADTDESVLMEIFEAHNFDETTVCKIINVMKENNLLIIERPY